MSKRRALGFDPLDTLVAAQPRPAAPARMKAAPKPRKATKAKATYLLPADLIDEARDAAVALSGPPHRLTLAALVEGAIRRELDRLKKAHTNGKPFPKHAGPLVGGRPISR